MGEEAQASRSTLQFNDLTLPDPLDESAFTFDQRQPQNASFSPVSPGKRSPARARTMKEYEEEITRLKKENFNLKVRIYFIEQNRNLPTDVEELQIQLTELKVSDESKKKELSETQDLLLKSYKVVDTLKRQLEALKAEQESERDSFLTKIDCLEKELKDYQVKFMETSIHLDDTNALYAMTFGLNCKAAGDKCGDSAEKIQLLEQELMAEKGKVTTVEDENSQLKSKVIRLQEELQKLQIDLGELKSDREKLKRERNYFEESANAVGSRLEKVEEVLGKKKEALQQKEDEVEHLNNNVSILEKRLTEQSSFQLEGKQSTDTLKNSLKLLTVENKHLKEELKEVEKKLLAKHSSSSDQVRELNRQLCESEHKLREQQKEFAQLRNAFDNGQTLIQTLLRKNKTLKRALDAANTTSRSQSSSASRDEDRKIEELIDRMSSDKDQLISELYLRIEELNDALKEKKCKLKERSEFETISRTTSSTNSDLRSLGDPDKWEKEIESLSKELDEKKKEVECLKNELRKKTFNLQGLVNTELWDKNREIEKLNKVCERKHLEVAALQNQLRDYQKTLVQEKVTSFVSSFSLQNGLLKEDKENMEPVSDSALQVRQLREEKRQLAQKVEELQARLLNTPERDTECLLVQSLRNERDQAERLRKEAVNACLLLTTRLQELADFLDSLLPTLCGKKRKVVQRAVERSRELSRSLSLAAEESSSVLHCSAWSDLQPSLYVPLLPDISTVDFWSGEDEEAFSEVARLKSQVETLTEEVKLKDGEIAKFQTEKQCNDSFVINSILNGLDNNFLDRVEEVLNLEEITEGSLVDPFNDKNISEKNQVISLTPEVKSTNIGKITVSSRKKDLNASHNLINVDAHSITNDKSENESWSEPDRDVSFARMGLKDSVVKINKISPGKIDETSETADVTPKASSPRRVSEIQRLQRKVNSLEQVNKALKNELEILHQLTPTMADKSTSIEEDDREPIPIVRLREVTNQLGEAERELSTLKSERDQWNKTCGQLRTSLQLKENELLTKQCALLELEKSASARLQEVEAHWRGKCTELEERCNRLDKSILDLQNNKELLEGQIKDNYEDISRLHNDIESHKHEKSKAKQLIEELNNKIQQLEQNLTDLQRVVSEQKLLMSDAERERQELATQLIARDRQVSDLEAQLSRVEQASSDIESALRSQLDAATQQCAQFEAKIRESDHFNKKREDAMAGELRRRLDAARLDHSEAVLQYNRLANENIRLQQQLRTCPPQPANNSAHMEKMKSELERRVAELESVNAELESRFNGGAYSDCETDTASSVGGSSHRKFPPPISLPPFIPDQVQTWPPTSPLTQASTSPDLGIESDQGNFSSLETISKSIALPQRGAPIKDVVKLEEENTQLRRNLQKTRHALEETLAQLTAANQHKRQYEAQLSAANSHGAKVERAICRQLMKTRSILKKTRVNLEDAGNINDQH